MPQGEFLASDWTAQRGWAPGRLLAAWIGRQASAPVYGCSQRGQPAAMAGDAQPVMQATVVSGKRLGKQAAVRGRQRGPRVA